MSDNFADCGTRMGVPLAAGQDAGITYRRLLARLASRARGLGSRDPEGAAQEALRRSLGNCSARQTIEYYFGESEPAGQGAPEWPLDQLFAWLHGVVSYVVREEQNSSAYRLEIPVSAIGGEFSDGMNGMEPADPAPDQLQILIRDELRETAMEFFGKLDPQHQTVLSLRARGLKYGEIADHLGVSENTVATWVSRGIRSLAQCIRRHNIKPIRGCEVNQNG